MTAILTLFEQETLEVIIMLNSLGFKGHDIECASIGEVLHALNVGFPPEKIVFDSPVEIVPELSMTFLLII